MLPERYLLSPNTAARLRDSLAAPPGRGDARHAGVIRSAPLVRRGALLTAAPLVYRGRLVGRPSPAVPWEDLGSADVALAPLNAGFLGLGRVYVAGPSGFTTDAESLPVYWTSGEAIEDESSSGSSEDSTVEHLCEGVRSQRTEERVRCEDGCLVLYTRTVQLVVDADGCPREVIGPWTGPYAMPGDCGLAFENCGGSSSSGSSGDDLIFTDCCAPPVPRTLYATVDHEVPGQDCDGAMAVLTYTEDHPWLPMGISGGWAGTLTWPGVTINLLLLCTGPWTLLYGDCSGGTEPMPDSLILGTSSCDPLLLSAVPFELCSTGCPVLAEGTNYLYITSEAP